MALTLMCPPSTLSAPSQCSDDQSRLPRAGTRCVPRCTCHWEGWYLFVLHQLLQSPIRLFSHNPFTLRGWCHFCLIKKMETTKHDQSQFLTPFPAHLNPHPSFPTGAVLPPAQGPFRPLLYFPSPHFLPSLLAIRLCHGADITLAPRDYWSNFWFYEWTFFACFIYMESYIVWSLVSGFLQLLSCFWGSLVTEHVSTLHSSLLLDNIPLYGQNTLCPFTNLWKFRCFWHCGSHLS